MLDPQIEAQDLYDILNSKEWKRGVQRKTPQQVEHAEILLNAVMKITSAAEIPISKQVLRWRKLLFEGIFQNLDNTEIDNEVSLRLLAQRIYEPCEKLLELQKNFLIKRTNRVGVTSQTPLHRCREQEEQTGEHLYPLLPPLAYLEKGEEALGFVLLPPFNTPRKDRVVSRAEREIAEEMQEEALESYASELHRYFNQHLDSNLPKPKVNTILIPVGPGHWQLVAIHRKKDNQFEVELFDSYGQRAPSLTFLSNTVKEIVKRADLEIGSMSIINTGPTIQQREHYSCGDFTVAWAHRKAKIQARKFNYDIGVMSELPSNDNEEYKNRTIITPQGLYQWSKQEHRFVEILSKSELQQGTLKHSSRESTNFFALAASLEKGTYQSILDVEMPNAKADSLLTHPQLYRLNVVVGLKKGHPCSLYAPKIVNTLETQGNQKGALRSVMCETSAFSEGFDANLEAVGERNSDKSHERMASRKRERRALECPEPSDDEMEAYYTESEKIDKQARRLLNSDELTVFGKKQDAIVKLKKLLQIVPNPEINTNVMKLIEKVEELWWKATEEDKVQLVHVLKETYNVLKPSEKNKKYIISKYKELASQVEGYPSPGWKSLGMLMLLLAVALVFSSGMVLASGGLLVGVPLAVASAGSFYMAYRFFRPAKLSKAILDIAKSEECTIQNKKST